MVLSIIALLIGLLMPALASARQTARQLKGTTQVRGIHMGLVLFAQSNNTYYPGCTSYGKVTQPTVEQRFSLLLEQQYFPGTYLVSPAEQRDAWVNGPVTTDHYSYSLLMVSASNSGTREQQWRDTQASNAPVLSDRAQGNLAGIKSIHTNPLVNATDWIGSVAWNDNHVTFEADHLVFSQLGSHAFDLDNLFEDEAGLGVAGNNAVMVWSGATGIVD